MSNLSISQTGAVDKAVVVAGVVAAGEGVVAEEAEGETSGK